MIGLSGYFAVCARLSATERQATTANAIEAATPQMKLLRLIAFPKAQDNANFGSQLRGSNQEIVTNEIGFKGILVCNFDDQIRKLRSAKYGSEFKLRSGKSWVEPVETGHP